MLTGNKVWDSVVRTTATEILKKIGDCCELPKIPNQISKDAKAFLKACLVKKAAFRFTAEMQLDHQFLSGIQCDYAIYESKDEMLMNSAHTLCDSDIEESMNSVEISWASDKTFFLFSLD
ncbi:mitogen-activated protein kinase kinase kinase 20-like [Mercurialis annua]|uniref:mitogen-activated protein kinase kinase kinase 20-like n=1 Tax=Mercurialis annua TaxID=3986 RepID=UPI00215FAF59|nr:mitogen-activated protein kinase kinase kinase 20-like [Mercurialis annua]